MSDIPVSGEELSQRTARKLTRALVISNVGGALDVFYFLAFLLPTQGVDQDRMRLLNGVVFVPCLVIGVAVGKTVGARIGHPVISWLESGQPPTEQARRAALRQPLWLMYLNGSLWLSAAVVFGLLNVVASPRLACVIALTIALGGFTTCTIAYLLAERIMRPVVSRAMDGAVEPPPVLLGVKPRLLLAWGVGSGLPLIAIAMGMLDPTPANKLGRNAILFLVFIGIFVGFASITAAAGAVSDPVRSVAGALRAVGQGELDASVPVYDASEVGRLQSGFNAMVEGLRERERMRDLFGRQVGDDVARIALERGAELGGELREVAVLFVDVVGSTELAQSVDPQEVVRRLNAFFSVVIDVVREHGGWVNKFEGDAALCIFGAPAELPDANTCALSAARELACRLQDLEVDAAIGVCAGPVVAGHVGAESRFEYTVIGDPVNAAARLTELAKSSDCRVLADADLLSPDNEEAGQWLVGESVVLRGRSAPTRLARPRDLAGQPTGR